MYMNGKALAFQRTPIRKHSKEDKKERKKRRASKMKTENVMWRKMCAHIILNNNAILFFFSFFFWYRLYVIHEIHGIYCSKYVLLLSFYKQVEKLDKRNDKNGCVIEKNRQLCIVPFHSFYYFNNDVENNQVYSAKQWKIISF